MATHDAITAAYDSRAWDEARNALKNDDRHEMELQALAHEFGLRWANRSGRTRLKAVLALSWSQVNSLWFYWHPMTLDDLARLLRAAARIEPFSNHGSEQEPEPIDVDGALTRLGISRTTSVELLRLSARARRFLREEGLMQVGPMLDHLAERKELDASGHKGIGRATNLELLRVLH